MPKSNPKNNSTVVTEDANLLEEFRKENARLQNAIAKNQVAYESEINKLKAQLSQAKAPQIVIKPVSASQINKLKR
jgi:hypothetical protein